MTPEELRIRLDRMEHQLKFFADAYKTLHNEFMRGVHVQFDRQLLKPSLDLIKKEASQLVPLIEKLTVLSGENSLIATISFMAKRLNEMESALQSIKEKGLKKNIHLSFTVDGYEMVKKKPHQLEEVDDGIIDNSVQNLLDSIDGKFQEVMIHRYGLLGQSVKTLDKVGKIIGLTRERVRQLQCRALRMCRHKNRKHLVDALTHLDLKKDILGE